MFLRAFGLARSPSSTSAARCCHDRDMRLPSCPKASVRSQVCQADPTARHCSQALMSLPTVVILLSLSLSLSLSLRHSAPLLFSLRICVKTEHPKRMVSSRCSFTPTPKRILSLKEHKWHQHLIAKASCAWPMEENPRRSVEDWCNSPIKGAEAVAVLLNLSASLFLSPLG